MNNPSIFKPELIQRYEGAGPRYTSYPTAPQFTSHFNGSCTLKAIQNSNEDPIPRALSLYVHIPFCFSPCFYCGCNRIISRDNGKKQNYLDTLLKEIRMLAPKFDSDREVVQLHLGGGTPNSLNTDQLAQLMRQLEDSFNFTDPDRREFSIEIDPRTVSVEDISALKDMGFNRVSLGIQDFDKQVQQAINRLQDIDQITAIFNACKQHGFNSINFDLIYGLPSQSLEGFKQTLATVSKLRPDRIALYSYAHMPTIFKAQNKINALSLPNPTLKLLLFQTAVEYLLAQGYEYIGMDHFALPQDELCIAKKSGDLHRNFMGYTTRKQTDLIGFGVSSISQIADSFSQNAKDISSWQNFIERGTPATVRGITTNRDDQIRADIIQEIMCQGNVYFSAFEHRYNIVFTNYFSEALSKLAMLEQDCLVEIDNAKLTIQPAGRLLLRVIASCFDAYLNKAELTALPQSKAV